MAFPTHFNEKRARALEDVIETVRRLRAPNGCPWDRAQTHQSLRPYLIEEAYEVLDVVDRIDSPAALADARNKADFREELGDLLMQVLLHSEMTAEAGAFSIEDVANGLNEKLVRRHPHVFGGESAEGADAALANWEKEKAKEKSAKAAASSVLDGLPKGLPALQRTARVIEKVTKVGFQWPDLEGPWLKVEEELGELKAEVKALKSAAPGSPETEELRARVAGELGDLFFTLANVAHLLKIAPEDALRGTNARFERRFRHVEKRLRENGKAPEQSTLEEMDKYWDEAKALERESREGAAGGGVDRG